MKAWHTCQTPQAFSSITQHCSMWEQRACRPPWLQSPVSPVGGLVGSQWVVGETEQQQMDTVFGEPPHKGNNRWGVEKTCWTYSECWNIISVFEDPLQLFIEMTPQTLKTFISFSFLWIYLQLISFLQVEWAQSKSSNGPHMTVVCPFLSLTYWRCDTSETVSTAIDW